MKIESINKIKLKLDLFNFFEISKKEQNHILLKMLDLNLKMHEINYPNLSKKDFNNLQNYYSKMSNIIINSVDKLLKKEKLKKEEIDDIKGLVQILKVDILDKLNDIEKSPKILNYIKKNLNNFKDILKNNSFDSLESIIILFKSRDYFGDFQQKTKTFKSGLTMEIAIKNLNLYYNDFYELKGYSSGWMLESLDYELLSQKTSGIVNHIDYQEWHREPKQRILMSMDIEIKVSNSRHLIDVKNYSVSQKNGLKLSFHHSLKDMSKNLTKSYIYNKFSSYMYTFFNKKKEETNSYLIPFKIMKNFIKDSLKDPTIRTEDRVIKISNNKFNDIFSEFKIDFENLNLDSFFNREMKKENNIERNI